MKWQTSHGKKKNRKWQMSHDTKKKRKQQMSCNSKDKKQQVFVTTRRGSGKQKEFSGKQNRVH